MYVKEILYKILMALSWFFNRMWLIDDYNMRQNHSSKTKR